MKSTLVFIGTIMICTTLAGQTKSSEYIGSSGGTMQNEKTTCSYSIGEIAIETHKSSQLTITQGFQQPYLPMYTTNTNEMLVKDGKWLLYPNPTINTLNIDYSQSLKKEVTIKIFDLQGNCLISINSQQEKTQLNISHLASGYYFVSIYSSNGNRISTFKINKTTKN